MHGWGVAQRWLMFRLSYPAESLVAVLVISCLAVLLRSSVPGVRCCCWLASVHGALVDWPGILACSPSRPVAL
eukprot:3153157-Pyramimonas_sp.AAC.1